MRIATAIRSLVLTAAVSIIPAASYAGVFVSIGIGAPPVLPVYAQPICPAAGYIWTPGYWAYDDEAGYYWVPGAWVLAPYTGALWTPGYWGWGNGGYYWHPGYWGRHVGFYGGVNYGFGYFGRGYEGGYWDHDRFAYNRSVTNVNIVNVHNVYNKTVINNYNTTRVSFNGGHGGVQMRPTQQEQNWGREQHTAPLPAQHQNEMRASQNRLQFANVNHGRPQNLARTEPASYNRNMLTTNRPSNTMAPTTHPVNTVAPGNIHSPAVNNARPMPTDQNVNRAPVNNNNVAHPQTNPQLNQHAQPQPNRPQPSMQANQHMQPQPMRPEPQQMRQPQQQMRTEPQQVRSQQPQMHSEPQQMRQAPQQMHSQPQQMRSAPQQPHPQESHGGGGHDGGHGRGR